MEKHRDRKYSYCTKKKVIYSF